LTLRWVSKGKQLGLRRWGLRKQAGGTKEVGQVGLRRQAGGTEEVGQVGLRRQACGTEKVGQLGLRRQAGGTEDIGQVGFRKLSGGILGADVVKIKMKMSSWMIFRIIFHELFVRE
jgi:hypothetical protein